MKNICFVIKDITLSGGTERTCCTLANKLTDLGYKVSIFSLSKKNDIFFELNEKVNVFFRPLFRFFPKRYSHFYKKRLWVHSLVNFVKKNKVDCVIDVMIYYVSITCEVKKAINFNHIIWDHMAFEVNQIDVNWLNNLKANQHYVDYLVTLTKTDKDKYIDHGIIDENKIVPIFNLPSIQKPCFSDRSNNKKIIGVGKFNEDKGFDYLLKAWYLIEHKFPDWTLELWGKRDCDSDYLEKLSADLGIKNVKFFSAEKDIKKIYDKAGLFVLSSRYEGVPLVLFEACSYALPIVTFDCSSGIKELFEDRKNALVVKSFNYHDLAHAIYTLIRYDNLRKRLSKNAYSLPNLYDVNKTISQWVNLIEQDNHEVIISP